MFLSYAFLYWCFTVYEMVHIDNCKSCLTGAHSECRRCRGVGNTIFVWSEPVWHRVPSARWAGRLSSKTSICFHNIFNTDLFCTRVFCKNDKKGSPCSCKISPLIIILMEQTSATSTYTKFEQIGSLTYDNKSHAGKSLFAKQYKSYLTFRIWPMWLNYTITQAQVFMVAMSLPSLNLIPLMIEELSAHSAAHSQYDLWTVAIMTALLKQPSSNSTYFMIYWLLPTYPYAGNFYNQFSAYIFSDL